MPVRIIDYSDVLPVERLRALFRYEPDSGKLFWRTRPLEEFDPPKYFIIWNKRHAGKEAGTVSKKDGYRYLFAEGVRVVAHRVIWAMAYGYWPTVALDHEDQDRLNNRLGNLREAGYGLNALNRSMKSDNTSGCTGVDPKPAGNWHARIMIRGQKIFLGAYDTFEAAAAARKKAQDDLGFSPNHGRSRA